MLAIKTPPAHNFSLMILPASEVDPEWMIGRITEDNKFIESEIECTLDGKKAAIKLISQYKVEMKLLKHASDILRLTYGMTGEQVKNVLLKKYKGLTDATEIRLIIYELLEFE